MRRLMNPPLAFPSGLLMATGSTRRFSFLTGGRVSRAGIASRATEASDVAIFERETYEPG